MPRSDDRPPILLLRPPGHPPREHGRQPTTRHEALDEILEGLQEGGYALHHASSDLKHYVIAHEGDPVGRVLGGHDDPPMSVLVPAHENRSSGEPVHEALRVLSSPVFNDDGDLRARISVAIRAIVCANGIDLDEDAIVIVRTATPWGPFGITYVPTNAPDVEIDVDPALAALLPMIVDADWMVLDTRETALDLTPLSVTVWPHLRMDHVEALRVLSDLAERPIV